MFVLFICSDILLCKYDQQKVRADGESASKYAAEQRSICLEQALNTQELKSDELTRKYMTEIENVRSFFKFKSFKFDFNRLLTNLNSSSKNF